MMQVIELCTAEQQTQLVRKIEPHVLTVVKDTNGNHVCVNYKYQIVGVINYSSRSSRSS